MVNWNTIIDSFMGVIILIFLIIKKKNLAHYMVSISSSIFLVFNFSEFLKPISLSENLLITLIIIILSLLIIILNLLFAINKLENNMASNISLYVFGVTFIILPIVGLIESNIPEAWLTPAVLVFGLIIYSVFFIIGSIKAIHKKIKGS